MANDEIEIDGEAIKAAVSSLTSSKPKNKAGLSARKTSSEKKTAGKTTTKKASSTAKSKTAKSKTTKSSESSKKSTASKTTTRKTTTKKPTEKKTTEKKTSAKKTTEKKTSSEKTTRSRGLEADIKKYEGETYTRMELMDGIRLAVQDAGAEAIQKTMMAMVTDWTPILGEKLEKEAVNLIVRKTKSTYSKSSTDQKKSLRAVIHWIRNDFDLGKSLDASEFTSGFAATGSGGSTSTPLNLKPLNEK